MKLGKEHETNKKSKTHERFFKAKDKFVVPRLRGFTEFNIKRILCAFSQRKGAK